MPKQGCKCPFSGDPPKPYLLMHAGEESKDWAFLALFGSFYANLQCQPHLYVAQHRLPKRHGMSNLDSCFSPTQMSCTTCMGYWDNLNPNFIIWEMGKIIPPLWVLWRLKKIMFVKVQSRKYPTRERCASNTASFFFKSGIHSFPANPGSPSYCLNCFRLF